MTVLYDPQVMQALAQACQAANDELQRAQSLILAVRSHEDWGCREKDAIDDLMSQCRNYVNTLCEEQHSFLDAVKIVETDLNEAEGKISGLFQSVDDMIANILAVPAPTAVATGAGMLASAVQHGMDILFGAASGGGAGHTFGSSGVQHGGGGGHGFGEGSLADIFASLAQGGMADTFMNQWGCGHTGEMYNTGMWSGNVVMDGLTNMEILAQKLVSETRGGMDHLLDAVVPTMSQPFLEELNQNQPLLNMWKEIMLPPGNVASVPSFQDYRQELHSQLDVFKFPEVAEMTVEGASGIKLPEPWVLIPETVPDWGHWSEVITETAEDILHTGNVRRLVELGSQIPVTLFEDLRL